MSNRLVSLDVFRGITMFLLVAERTHLYHALETAMASPDLWTYDDTAVSPSYMEWIEVLGLDSTVFMFIVGVAKPFSL